MGTSRFEYLVDQVQRAGGLLQPTDEQLEARLNELSLEGWELVSTTANLGQTGYLLCLRRLSNEA